MIFTKVKQFIEQNRNNISFLMRKKELENQVSEIIDTQSFKILGEILENGYILTNKQHKKLGDFLLKHDDYTKRRELANCGCQFSDDTLKRILRERPNIITNDYYDNVSKQFKNKIKNDASFNLEIFNDWKKTVLSYKEISWMNISEFKEKQEVFQFLKNHWKPLLTEDILLSIVSSFNKIKSSTSNYEINSAINSFSNELSDYFQSNASNTKNEIINKTKEIFLNENIEKNISKLSEKQILDFSVKKLPSNIQAIVSKIESNCQKLSKFNDVEIKHIVNQTIDKLLPETLKKYSLMDDEYKTTMKNKDGKSAQDLLIESLKNMNDRLVNIIQKNNESQLLEMEIGATFTKKLKNG